MKPKVEIYYRMNTLDKVHEYPVISQAGTSWTIWFWFYLGHLMSGKTRIGNISIFNYPTTWNAGEKTIKAYKAYDAKLCATRVHLFIMNHKRKKLC